MNWLYRHCLRPVLFAQDPEEIHRFTLGVLAWAGRYELLTDATASFLEAPELPVSTLGMWFPNPIGLAAGMDKDGEAVPIWPALGFGHVEIGAVTSLAQSGNPAPRVFRAIPDDAIINRMGFNNAGAQALADTLARWHSAGRWPRHPVGINLGKSKATPLDQAPEDYAQSLRLLWAHADFFVVNVSSPNTPNLRELQNQSALNDILAALQEVNHGAAAAVARATKANRGLTTAATDASPKPILVKVAPDLSWEALDEIVELIGPRRIAGLVATNTTITRPTVHDADLERIYEEAGGLSGRPLRQRSTEVIRHLYRQTRGRVPIIGVGGIFNADDAWEKITAGACLLQVYTGLVYEGPGIARQIVRGLLARLEAEGLKDLSKAVGRDSGSR